MAERDTALQLQDAMSTGSFDPLLCKLYHCCARPTDIWDTNTWGGLPLLDNLRLEIFPAGLKNFNDQQGTQPNNASAHLPNPCLDSDFQTPVYDFIDWNVTRVYLNASNEYPNTFHIAVMLRDSANNYSLKCTGEHVIKNGGPYEQRYTHCAPEGGFHDGSFQPIVSFGLYEPILTQSTEPGSVGRINSNVGLQQYWICTPPANSSSYSRVFKGTVRADIRLACPARNGSATGELIQCNTTTTGSLRADYTPKYNASETSPLVPWRFDPPPAEDGLHPAPPRDCTDLSFTHPDVIVENGAVFVIGPQGRGSSMGHSLNLNLTSRVTGVSHSCCWGEAWNNTEVYQTSLVLRCAPLPNALPDPSVSTFRMEFTPLTSRAVIQHWWGCGDAKGTYSRRYRTYALYTMPLYCLDGDTKLSTCRANRHTVKGQLQVPAQYDPVDVPPPPGASKAGCTAVSLAPQWVVRSFRYEERRNWRSQVANATAPPVAEWNYKPQNTLSLDLLNKANDYAVSCRLDLSSADLANNTWQRCFPDTGRSQYFIETYVRFHPATAVLSVNQTWYCSDTDASQPLLYEGAVSVQVQYCGETIERQRDVCNRRTFPRGCDINSMTRWCQTGLYNLQAGVLQPADVTVRGNTVRTSRLPANALVDPDPNPDVPVTWTISQFKPEGFFHTYWLYMSIVSPPTSVLSFDFANSAFTRRPGAGGGLIKHVEANTPALSPFTSGWRPAASYGQLDDPWWTFGFGGHFPFDNALSWRMRFDATTGYLEMNHVWYCNDKNPDTPLLFNGTWAGHIKMRCGLNDMYDPDRVEIGCFLPNSSVTVAPQVYSQKLRSMAELPR
ncbi:hypothetical protein B0T25DRAFT_636249 [Lasiosphaeria hispida]|uniref:Uncharacterized protein n=1 Tax=Lasiosphaeria hispida TaxID=260671 RepID=A0AAJ0H5C0_9PEZI|nr:hypothetical protein B0T25DRAFT_636249 [Lasiosphaeria hispida]